MQLQKIERNHQLCAVVRGEGKVMTDAGSALELLMQASYELGTKNIAISKRLVAEEFFILSSGLAGEILQKYVNYGGRIAIYGDFSHYTSKPLRDFIRESNRGRDVFFVPSQEEAIDRLTRVTGCPTGTQTPPEEPDS